MIKHGHARILVLCHLVSFTGLAFWGRALQHKLTLFYTQYFLYAASLIIAAISITLIGLGWYYIWLSNYYSKVSLLFHVVGLVVILSLVPFYVVAFVEYSHIVFYGSLAISVLLWLGLRIEKIPLAIALSAVVSLAEEGLQGVIPNRVFDWRDIALNFGGSFCGIYLIFPAVSLRAKLSANNLYQPAPTGIKSRVFSTGYSLASDNPDPN